MRKKFFKILLFILALAALFFWNKKHPLAQMGRDFRNIVSNSTSRQYTEADAQRWEREAAISRAAAQEYARRAEKTRENQRKNGWNVEQYAVEYDAQARMHAENAQRFAAQAAAMRQQAQGQKESEAYAARQQKAASQGGSPRKAQEDYVGANTENGWYVLSFN